MASAVPRRPSTAPIGIYQRSLPDSERLNAREALVQARDLGLNGCLFASPLALSPRLDPAELAELRGFAAELGIALAVGVGRIHPFQFDTLTEVRVLGDGDFRSGLEKLVRTGQDLGCRELWFSIGSLADRFDRSVPWSAQLAAVEAFLRSFAPVLRDLGCRLNLKTHEEITSFEVVRLVEAVGPDVLGVSYDPVNVLVRLEDPVAAARRVARYVHHLHVDDAALFFTDDGLERKLYPCGEGVIDWPAILGIFAEQAPPFSTWIELHRGQFRLPLFDPGFLASQPDLAVAELAELTRLATVSDRKLARGEIPPPDAYQTEPVRRLQPTLAYLRGVLR